MSMLRYRTFRQTTSIGTVRRSLVARPLFAIASSASTPWTVEVIVGSERLEGRASRIDPGLAQTRLQPREQIAAGVVAGNVGCRSHRRRSSVDGCPPRIVATCRGRGRSGTLAAPCGTETHE